MSTIEMVLQLDAGEIAGIVTTCGTVMVAVIGAIGKIINDKRRERGYMKCCITHRKLKPKKTKEVKK